MTRQSSGFTLVEILIATAIFATIMIAALMIYDKNQQVFKQSVEAADMQQNSRVAFDKMVSEIRMAGFDYDRDGQPTLAGSSEQPDEQIEYADTRAVTVRANYDYDANVAGDADNGRETGLESAKFPVVTTGNDEIVTYALHSKNSGSGANPSTITFKVDVTKPRNGTETTISIDNVDLTGKNPPYELQRISIDPADNTKLVRTTIADNIRDMKFNYYTDLAGVAANEVTTMPVGTDANTAIRATIRSIKVQLTGMNANPDVNYVNPTETDTTVTTAKNYRTYNLESLLVPRNLGLKGLQEVEATSPGAPTIKGVCIGACGFAYVAWDPPTAGAGVTAYTIAYDNSAGDAGIIPLGNVLNGWAGPLIPTTSYVFKVRSLNGYGSNSSGASSAAFPTNKTKPEQPGGSTGTGLSATGGGTALADQINVVWPNPKNNVSGSYGSYGGSTSCTAPPSASVMPSLNEVATYKVYRSTTTGFTPSAATLIWSGGLTAGVLDRDTSNNLVFHDVVPVTPTPGITYPPAKLNCTTYYYKIVGVEPCSTAGAANDNDAAASTSTASNEISGNSNSNTIPATPAGLNATGASGCSGGVCTVVLQWNEVTQDTGASPNKIQIANYVVHRQIWKLGSMQSEKDITPTFTNTPGTTPTLTDTGADLTPSGLPQKDALGNFFQYRYTVKAVQACTPASESAFSSQVIWPCANFTVDPPATGVISGSGAATDPYLITSPSGTFTINGNAPISAVVASYTNLTSGAATLLTCAVGSPTCAPVGAIPANKWTVNLPLSANDGTRYRIDVTITDSANGCTTSNSPGTFAEDAPTSCCLEPYKLASTGNPIFNNAVLTLDSANNTVNVSLVNDCASDLTITKVNVDFTDDNGNPSGRLKLKRVDFISPVGTGQQDFGGTAQGPPIAISATTAPLLPTLPANVKIIRSATANKTYTLGMVFQNRSVTLADIKQVCITYTDAAGNTFACRIAPQASATASCAP